MKKLLSLGILLLSVSMLHAQVGIFKPFKVDVSFGYAMPAGGGAKGGVLFAVEPKYAVLDQLAVGLRMEAAVTARAAIAPDGSSASGDVKASGSYLATGDYYFVNTPFRPFVGAGAGIFTLAAVSAGADNQGNTSMTAASSSKFGGLVRAGFEFGHFRLGVEYNLVSKSTVPVYDMNGNSLGNVDIKNSYLGLKAGFFFGGGRKK
jgi:outer membrane protein X